MLAPIDENRLRTVWLVNVSPSSIVEPISWKQAIRGPYRSQWIEFLFKHLDKNQSYGTFDLPVPNPRGKAVLDDVLAIRHKLDEFNRLVERKGRVCAHCGQQVAGLHYDGKPFAPAIFGTSLRILVALACWFGLPFWHVDVSNAFQSTPDESGTTYICCFPEYMDWVSARYPDHYERLKREHPKLKPSDFAMLMLKYVQGRVDASKKWREYVESVIIDEIHLVPSRADPCVYSGLHNGDPIIIGRATDNFLLVTTDAGDKSVVKVLSTLADGNKRRDIHDFGKARFFFGIRVVQSEDAITLDQRLYAFTMLTQVYGPSWVDQKINPKRHVTPLPTGNEYEAKLAAEVPFSPH